MYLRKSLSICIVIVLLLSSTTSSSFSASISDTIKNEASKLWSNLDNGKYNNDQLLSAAEKLLKKYPIEKYSDSYLILEVSVYANSAKGKYYTAEKQALTLVKYAPKQYYGYFLLGDAQFNLNKISEAEKNLKKAISLNPNTSSPYHFLGLLYSKSKKYHDAATYSMRAVMLDPYDNIENVTGYIDEENYSNQMLSFMIDIKPEYTYYDRDSYSKQVEEVFANNEKAMMANPGLCLSDIDLYFNEIFLNDTIDNSISIVINGEIFANPSEAPQSEEACKNYLNNAAENEMNNPSEITSTKLGKNVFSTFTSDRVYKGKDYKVQTYILVRDGVVTFFEAWASSLEGLEKARKVLETFSPY